jgi:hypothetical protein
MTSHFEKSGADGFGCFAGKLPVFSANPGGAGVMWEP